MDDTAATPAPLVVVQAARRGGIPRAKARPRRDADDAAARVASGTPAGAHAHARRRPHRVRRLVARRPQRHRPRRGRLSPR